MTSREVVGMELRVLGPFQVLVDGAEIPVGGAKQRTVLATLLLHAGEVVSVERLVDEIWGESPPPSATHSLESYVSRLRQLLNGHGPLLVRRGSGYSLELGEATLDATAFETLAELAGEATDDGDHRRTSDLARQALSCWRGPALGDVALGPSGRAAAERLEELRLHTLELRLDAELALGRDKELVSELQALVNQSPYREQFVSQLMLALYRSGRQAEALDVYERTRRRLDADLGLQPGLDLRTLSCQIVRQETHLHTPVRQPPEHLLARPRPRRVATLVAGGLAAAAVMSLTASGGTVPSAESAGLDSGLNAERVAIVLPRDPDGAGPSDPSVHWSAVGFRNTTTTWGQEAETFVIGAEASAQSQAAEVVDGDFDLVVVVGDGPGVRALASLVPSAPLTRFAFVGVRLVDLGLANEPNVAGYGFADEESGQLAGYLSGLVPPRGGRGARRADLISVVASPRTSETERFVAGFVKGAKQASAKLHVRVDYVPDTTDRTACEAIANDQIDAGSDVVLALGATCGSGALATVRTRGVWGIRLEDDLVQRGEHVLGTLTRYWEGAVSGAINDVELDSFPAGEEVELGLADDYSVLFSTEDHPLVAESLWSKVVDLCSRIRERAGTPDTYYGIP